MTTRRPELDALVRLLNATDEECAALTEHSAGVLEVLGVNWPEALPNECNFAGSPARALAACRVAAEVMREVGGRLADGEEVGEIDYQEECLLETFAAVRLPNDWWCRADERVPAEDCLPLTLAARGLVVVLHGEAELARCDALLAGHTDPSRTCGRAYIREHGVGRPATGCSDACRQRRRNRE